MMNAASTLVRIGRALDTAITDTRTTAGHAVDAGADLARDANVEPILGFKGDLPVLKQLGISGTLTMDPAKGAVEGAELVQKGVTLVASFLRNLRD